MSEGEDRESMSPEGIEDAVALCLGRYWADSRHGRQVARLALMLFDDLRELHEMGDEEREYLEYAALMHDIGSGMEKGGHNKRSLKIILEDDVLPFSKNERLIIGNIARYHRDSHPNEAHPHFYDLEPADKWTVSLCAALLRIAEGLDCTHSSIVEDVVCTLKKNRVVFICTSPTLAPAEMKAARLKSSLFVEIFRKKVHFENAVVEWGGRERMTADQQG